VDELLTAEEVAERLRTSPRFVRRLIAERRIAFTKVGKYVRIAARDVDSFIAAGRVEPGASYVRPNVVPMSTRK
jgi:excisionase family DNA binding protein